MRREREGESSGTEQPRCRALWLFPVGEGIFYVWFLAEDFSGKTFLLSSDLLKYISIWGCFLMALYLCESGQGNGWMLLAQALILPADLILLFADWAASLGVLFFLGVQTCYFVRLRQNAPRRFSFSLLFGGGTALSFLLLLFVIRILQLPYEPLTVLAALYLSVFFLNVLCGVAWALRVPRRTHFFFALGLILFFLCDLNVGLHFLDGSLAEGSFAAAAASRAGILMWFFYLPGQVLLVLSAVRNRGEKRSVLPKG